MIKTGQEPEKRKVAQLIYDRIVFLPKDKKVTFKNGKLHFFQRYKEL